jgi:hypothetical protein
MRLRLSGQKESMKIGNAPPVFETESAFSAILMLGEVGSGLRKEVLWMKINVEIDATTLVLLVLNILAFSAIR